MASIKISRGNDILYETSANGEENITSLASAIRTVQKESNTYLSKLVEEEKSSNNNTGGRSCDGNDDDEEDDDESEEDTCEKQADTKDTEAGKRRITIKCTPDAKKLCLDK